MVLHVLLLKRIAALPVLQEKRTIGSLFNFLAQTIHHILEQDLTAMAIFGRNRFCYYSIFKFPLFTFYLK
jgi:hypothetical protein